MACGRRHLNGSDAVLTYRCPDTGQFVQTDIRTSQTELKRLGQFKLSLWCPHCQAAHQIVAANAFITEQVDAA
jgi:hypothetical protein